MQSGHEDCPHDVEYVRAWQGNERQIIRCQHEHNEEVQADDMLGSGPVVADYCNCCGRFRTREDYR